MGICFASSALLALLAFAAVCFVWPLLSAFAVAACSVVQVVGRSVVQGTGRKAGILGVLLAAVVC